LAQALKEADQCNVVVVDWSGGSLVQYIQSTANIRLVALEVAYLLKYLKERYRLSYADVHLVGHSLGAHLAGHVGSLLPGIGRITGEDLILKK
jgi:pancreatic triacylglycerol lipase